MFSPIAGDINLDQLITKTVSARFPFVINKYWEEDISGLCKHPISP